MIVIEPGLIETEFSCVVANTVPQEYLDGSYQEIVQALTRNAGGENGRSYSPPSVIANMISRVIIVDRPRTRYAVGAMVRQLILMRK